MKSQAILAILLILFSVVLPAAKAASEQSDPPESLDRITNEIVHQEIELERFYLKYQMSGGKEPKWRYYRYFALQNAGTACTLASNLIGVNQSGSNLYHPDRISRRTSRKALASGLMGVLFDATSSGIELTSNGLLAIANKYRHNDPKWALKSVIERLRSIDDLMARRKALIARMPDSQAVALANSENEVLQCFRDWCVWEFCGVYADIKSYQASTNVYYALNIGSNGAYVASYALDYKLFNHPELTGKAEVCAIVGDSIGVADVPASALAYKLFYNFWLKRAGKKLHHNVEDTEPLAKAAMAKMDKNIASTTSGAIASNGSVRERLAIYHDWCDRYDDFIRDGIDEQRENAKVALQGNISGPAISSTYLAADIMGALAFYSTKENHERAQTSLTYAGAVSSLVGTSASLVLTNLMFVHNIMHRKKMEKKHHLPEQLVADRFKTLDALQSRLNLAQKGPGTL